MLLYLLNFIKKENKLLRTIIKNELNSVLFSDSKDEKNLFVNPFLNDNNNGNNNDNYNNNYNNNNNYNYNYLKYHHDLPHYQKYNNIRNNNFRSHINTFNNYRYRNNNNYLKGNIFSILLNGFLNGRNNYNNKIIKKNTFNPHAYPFYSNRNNYNNIYRCNYNSNLMYNNSYQTQQIITEKQHITKYFDYQSIKNNFEYSNNYQIKKRFYEVLKEEELYETRSKSFFDNIINLFKSFFKMKNSKNEDTLKNHLKLIPYKKNIYKEKTILILISGYLSPNDDHFKELKQLIKVYKAKFNNPIIYFFNWPSSKFQFKKILYFLKDFKNARERGKICGRILALMIMSNNFFDGFKINLVGFSLGNHVIKHCIKEIERFRRFDILNNIVFMGGATDIKCNFKWEHRLGSVQGTVINCYSDIDLVLACCKLITGKDTIGTKKLNIKNVKNYLIKSFHIFYRINMDKIGRKFIDELKE